MKTKTNKNKTKPTTLKAKTMGTNVTTNTDTAKTVAAANEGKAKSYVLMPLTDIFCDVKKFNGRSVNFLDEDDIGKLPSDADQGKYAQVKASIAEVGQDTPIQVRDNPDTSVNKQPKMVVTGHKRYSAISKHNADGNKIPNLPDGMILVEDMGPMSDSAAYLLNARENIVRDSFNPADLAFSVHRLVKESGKNQTEIAGELGIKQGYVSRLFTVVEKLDPKLFKLYRAGGVKVGLEEVVEIARLPKDKQGDAWTAATTDAPAKTDTEKHAAKIKSAKDRAKEIGRTFGVAAKLEIIDATDDSIDWPNFLPEVMTLPEGASDSDKEDIAKAAGEGFAAGSAVAPEPSTAPVTGTGAGGDAGGKGKRGKKGAAASPTN